MNQYLLFGRKEKKRKKYKSLKVTKIPCHGYGSGLGPGHGSVMVRDTGKAMSRIYGRGHGSGHGSTWVGSQVN